MAVPKRRTSKRKKRARRTHYKAVRTTLQACPRCVLRIGEEDEKGNAVVKEAHQLLKQTPGLNYIGNVEGREIPVGEARGQRLDVVACDGFVGNVVLKFYESAGRVFVSLIKREAPDVLQRPEMANVLKVL